MCQKIAGKIAVNNCHVNKSFVVLSLLGGKFKFQNTAMEISTKFIHQIRKMHSKAQHLNKYDENICEQMMDSIVVVEIQISKHEIHSLL